MRVGACVVSPSLSPRRSAQPQLPFLMKVTMSIPCAGIRSISWVVFVALFLATLASLPAQSAAGRIEGIVRNATTGSTLNNARVVVEGTTLETFTDDAGQYRLANVPPGDVRLRVSYT